MACGYAIQCVLHRSDVLDSNGCTRETATIKTFLKLCDKRNEIGALENLQGVRIIL